MTTASDRPEAAAPPLQKSRRRRPPLNGLIPPASASLSSALDESLALLAPSPPPVEPMEDGEDVLEPPSRSRSRSSSSTRKSRRATPSGGDARSRRMTAASSIAAAKNARSGFPDGRDVVEGAAHTRNNNEEEDGGDSFRGDDHVHGDDAKAPHRHRSRSRSRSRSRRATISTGPDLFPPPGRDLEAASDQHKGERRSGARPLLPPRSRHYRQLSAGPNKSSIAHQHSDRPPSRQRHAFPTHLIDANAFCASADGDTASEMDADNDEAAANDAELVAYTSQTGRSAPKNERPPSRYMVKSNRRVQAESASSHRGRSVVADAATTTPQSEAPSADTDTEGDAGGRRVPSRRLPVEYGGFSCNQAHHDPKTDGFADVDESIPPPFRIEITTESSSSPSPSNASSPSSSTPPASHCELGFTSRPGGRPPRRAASFNSSQYLQQLGQSVKRAGDCRASKPRHSLKSPFNPLQWFGEDDQINDPDNFETVVTASSPPHADPEREEECGDPSTEHDEDEEVEEAVGGAQAQRPVLQPPPTAPVAIKSGGHSWMAQPLTSSAAAKALLKSGAPDYDSMDADTAIAETPLYDGSDDFMAIATQMSDLRLDDYSLADVMATTSTSSGGGSNAGIGSTAAGLGGAAPPLHTSLGRDFLSLFAQH